MLLSTLQDNLVLMYETRKSFEIEGSSGMGKTETLAAAPKLLSQVYKKSFGVVIINCANLTQPDSIGYLLPRNNPDGSADSFFSYPFYFKTLEGKYLWEYDGGVIIFDMWDKAHPDVKKALGECRQSRRIGMHVIPDTWVMWATANRVKDRSGRTKTYDDLINRVCILDVQPSFDGWRDNYALPRGLLPITIMFAEKNPEIVFSDEPPKEQRQWCTARSLSEWDHFYQIATKFNNGVHPENGTIMEYACGYIGKDEAAQYFATLALHRELPNAEEVFRNPTTTRVSEKLDGMLLVTYELAHRVTAATAAAAIIYMERMPKEFAVIFVKSATKRDLMLVPTLRPWTRANTHLLNMLNDL